MGRPFGTPSSPRLKRPQELALAQLCRETRAPSTARIPFERTQIPGTCTGYAVMGARTRRRRLSTARPAKEWSPRGANLGVCAWWEVTGEFAGFCVHPTPHLQTRAATRTLPPLRSHPGPPIRRGERGIKGTVPPEAQLTTAPED